VQNCFFFWGQAPRPPTVEGTAPPQTPPLHSSHYLSPTFYLTPTPLCAMCDKIQNGILSGRPFGGLGVLIRKSLRVNVTVLEVMANCRCVALKCTFLLVTLSFSFLCIFPM